MKGEREHCDTVHIQKKKAAVCNSNDLLSSESSEMAFLSVRLTATESQETATCLIRKKAKDVSEKREVAFLRGTPAHSALLGVAPALPSLHIRAPVHAHAPHVHG